MTEISFIKDRRQAISSVTRRISAKFIRLLVCTLFITVVVPWVPSAFSFGGGTGTPDDPWEITSVEHLDNVRNYLTRDFILKNDINLDVTPYNTETGWQPIGGSTNPFTGSFDGNGNTIGDLTINATLRDYMGLFGYTKNAAISNLSLVNIDVTGGNYVGGLVGYNSNSYVSNCYVSGTIDAGFGIGGLVGGNDDRSTINLSGARVDVRSDNDVVGGLVGENIDSEITRSYATGSASGKSFVGGLVGTIYAESYITNSYATSDVTGDSEVGGLVGTVQDSAIRNSYAAGIVTGRSILSITGGLIGSQDGVNTVSASFWDTDSSGIVSSAGGTGQTTDEMRTMSTFTAAGWDFEDIWDIEEDETYPFLRGTDHDNNNGNGPGSGDRSSGSCFISTLKNRQ